jgi:hypothetical protein
MRDWPQLCLPAGLLDSEVLLLDDVDFGDLWMEPAAALNMILSIQT